MFWLWYTSLPSSWLKIDSFTISWFSHEGFNHTMSSRAQHKAVELKATNCIDNQAFWKCFSTNVPQHAPKMLACFPALQFFKLIWIAFGHAMTSHTFVFQVHMFEEKCFLYHLATTQLHHFGKHHLMHHFCFTAGSHVSPGTLGALQTIMALAPAIPPAIAFSTSTRRVAPGAAALAPAIAIATSATRTATAHTSNLTEKPNWFAWGGNVLDSSTANVPSFDCQDFKILS